MTKLFKMVSDQVPSAIIATVQRKYFNETKGTCIYTVYSTCTSYCTIAELYYGMKMIAFHKSYLFRKLTTLSLE